MSAPGRRCRSFKELIVWQKSMELAVHIYSTTGQFPREETFGLTSQMRRSAVSVPSNIAEGYGRNTTGELIQFLGHARGSLAELETQVLLAIELKFVNPAVGQETSDLIEEIGRLLTGFRKSLRNQ